MVNLLALCYSCLFLMLVSFIMIFHYYGVEDEVSISRSASSDSYPTSTSTDMGNMTLDGMQILLSFLVLRSWIIDDHFVCHIFGTVTRPYGQKISKTPPLPPRLTPTATPKVTSTAGSPKRSSVALLPKYSSGASSPTKNHFEGLTLSPWYPSSKQSSAANSPPRGRSIPGLFFCVFWLI